MKNPWLRFFLGLATLLGIANANATCLIFVHGKQTNTNTFTSFTAARNYWVNGADDFIRTATRQFAIPFYVVGYNGTSPYFESQAAGEVSNEIVNAINGGADGGGNRCSVGGPYIVIAHSMGATVMDFILGNNDSSDPNFNFNGPFDVVANNISFVISLSGTHRGSEGADAVCGNGGFLCNVIASFIQACDAATFWLTTDDSVQVRNFSSAPARNIFLTGGFEAIIGASACLSGEDDGVVQYASIYACGGDPTASFNNSNVCLNNKQEASGFFNLDGAAENHDDIRNDADRDERRQIPGGVWNCGSAPCPANTVVQSNMSTAQFISLLY